MADCYMDYSMMYPGGYGAGTSQQLPSHLKGLVNTIQDCEAVCEHMTTYVKKRHDVQARTRQLILLRDCADICGLTAKYVARNSPFARQAAGLCACICEVCGRECARFSDPQSQNCAQVCLNCARECQAFASGAMSSHMGAF